MTKTISTTTSKPMSFELLCKIWDCQQKQKARQNFQISRNIPRTLTMFEKYDKYAKLGHPLRYKSIKFVYINGFGQLTKADGTGEWNVTIGDFIQAVKQTYGKSFKWAEEYYNAHN